MKKGWNRRRKLPKVTGEDKPRKTLITKLQDTMLGKLLNFATSRPKQWMVSKSTTFMGVALILNAVSAVIKHLVSPGDIDINVMQAEWDNIMLGIAGLGLLEAKSNNTSTEEIKKVKKP